jgi:putative DNA methylase
MTQRKKLIEVALPLEAINQASAREKSIRHGHPSTLHLWWARRPLAACRAVLFASLVDDPSSHPDKFPTEEAQEAERQRLFGIIERLVKWENSNNETVLNEARAEILKSTNGNPPPVYDPFCGGGSIPLEAQRLGLEAHGSDLNPVAVLITKALIEIPPKFANRPPVHPIKGGNEELFKKKWRGAAGLAEDVRYYGQWMRDEAEKCIGHLYPKVKLPEEYGSGEATVIAWLWTRTVKCPNPACGAMMPLARSFALSTKKGKEAWVEPIITLGNSPVISFTVKTGKGEVLEGTVNRRGARCIACGMNAPLDHVRAEGRAKRIHAKLMAIVVEGQNGREYFAPNEEHIIIANKAEPFWKPDADLPINPRDFKTPNYGMRTFAELFTSRQLVALSTFSDLVFQARERVLADAQAAGMSDDNVNLNDGGTKATAYADAIATYLAFAVDRSADAWSTIASWRQGVEATRSTFARQALPMVWDYAEANPFSSACGNWSDASLDWIVKVLSGLSFASSAFVHQQDATGINSNLSLLISTDPPYYDNIGYADLSDFFYVWMRRALSKVYPDLFATLLVPKALELVATPYRFGGDKQKAQVFFEEGLGNAFAQMKKAQHSDFPLTVYYAFKQSESDEGDEGEGESLVTASTGWETMLEGLIRSGFSINGTWPMRTERGARNIGIGSNALASSIILVCRPRSESAAIATRREFLSALKRELPEALKNLQHGNIAPVDLAQASIGPGMGVFSRYSKIVEADGSPMRVRTALQIINQSLDEVLAEQESNYDPDTRWAVAWFDQFGMEEAQYGIAETLSKAKNTSVKGMEDAGVIVMKPGKVRLLKRDELPADWNPAADHRLTVWEVTQHLIHKLEQEGESGAAIILAKVAQQNGSLGEIARDLAYRLFTTCERKGWTQEALAYNSLVVAWPEISRLASQPGVRQPEQFSLLN